MRTARSRSDGPDPHFKRADDYRLTSGPEHPRLTEPSRIGGHCPVGQPRQPPRGEERTGRGGARPEDHRSSATRRSRGKSTVRKCRKGRGEHGGDERMLTEGLGRAEGADGGGGRPAGVKLDGDRRKGALENQTPRELAQKEGNRRMIETRSSPGKKTRRQGLTARTSGAERGSTSRERSGGRRSPRPARGRHRRSLEAGSTNNWLVGRQMAGNSSGGEVLR